MPMSMTLDRSMIDRRVAEMPAWLWPSLITGLSVVIFLFNTRHGIGILPDSTRYMQVTTLAYDAPLYPWLLSLVAMIGVDVVTSAKLIGLVLVMANTALVWRLLMRATGSPSSAIIGTGLVVLSPVFVTLHATAMSEPLFLFGLLVSILAFLEYVADGSRGWLVTCAVLVALTSLVRFTGPALGAGIAVCLLISRQHEPRRRLADAAIFAAVSSAIFLAWCAYSQSTSGHSIGRELQFFGNMGSREWLTSLSAMTAWLMPDDAPMLLRVVALAAVLAAAAVLAWRSTTAVMAGRRGVSPGYAILPPLLGLFFVAYLAFVWLSTALEANLYLNSRYAFPAYVALVLMLTILVGGRRPGHASDRWLMPALGVLAALVLAGHAVRTEQRTSANYRDGIGYASVSWARSPTMAALGRLPADQPVYTNAPDLVGYALRREAYFVPLLVPSRTGVPDPVNPYDRQVATLRQSLASQGGYVVFFNNVDWRFYLGGEPELVRRLGVSLVAGTADGRIYATRHDRSGGES